MDLLAAKRGLPDDSGAISVMSTHLRREIQQQGSPAGRGSARAACTVLVAEVLILEAGAGTLGGACLSRLLVWDLMCRPWLTRIFDALLNPILGKSIVLYFIKPPLDDPASPGAVAWMRRFLPLASFPKNGCDLRWTFCWPLSDRRVKSRGLRVTPATLGIILKRRWASVSQGSGLPLSALSVAGERTAGGRQLVGTIEMNSPMNPSAA